jgi:hypothetical protein
MSFYQCCGSLGRSGEEYLRNATEEKLGHLRWAPSRMGGSAGEHWKLGEGSFAN